MAKVKLIVGRAGVGFDQVPGEIVTVSDGEAVRMIATGQAVPVSAPETATLQTGKREIKKRRRATKTKKGI